MHDEERFDSSFQRNGICLIGLQLIALVINEQELLFTSRFPLVFRALARLQFVKKTSGGHSLCLCVCVSVCVCVRASVCECVCVCV